MNNSSMCVGADIAKSGFWVNTRIYQEGDHLNADVYLVHNGQARVLKATVDLRPIAEAVARYHKNVMHQAAVNGLLPDNITADEIGLSWGDFNPVKHIKKAAKGIADVVTHPLDNLTDPMRLVNNFDPTGVVKKVGRVKLLRQVNNSIRTITRTGVKSVGQFALNNPGLTSAALGVATAVFPPAAAFTGPAMAYLPAASAANKGIGVASRVARGKASLLNEGMKAVMSGVSSQLPVAQVAQNFAKYLPPEAKDLAPGIVKKAALVAIKDAGGTKGLSSMGTKQWGNVFRKVMPAQLKNVAREGLIASRAVVPNTAQLMPKVSDGAVGMYAIASKAVQAVERSKALQKLGKQVAAASAVIPSQQHDLKRKMAMLKYAQSRINTLPADKRGAAMQAVARQRSIILQKARTVGAVKKAVNQELQVAKAIGPERIRQIKAEGERAAILIRQTRAAAASPNPRVREQAAKAAAAFRIVANSRAKVRNLSRGKLPGFSVSGPLGLDLLVGDIGAMRLAQVSEVMPTIGAHSAQRIEIGCAACMGKCGR